MNHGDAIWRSVFEVLGTGEARFAMLPAPDSNR